MQGFERKVAYFTLRFDAETERSIIDLWIVLAEEGIEPVGLTGHRPHITVSAHETDYVESYFPMIDKFARKTAKFPITFGAIGVFPASGVVFLAPVVTDALRAVHRSLLAHLGGPGRPPVLHAALLPDRWVPHCTLADGADPGAVAQIVTFCARKWQPVEGWVEGIGIRVPPDTTDVYDVSFADGIARNEAY
jgi:2'-5' RNA ligase